MADSDGMEKLERIVFFSHLLNAVYLFSVYSLSVFSSPILSIRGFR